jgi:hypothetical protein
MSQEDFQNQQKNMVYEVIHVLHIYIFFKSHTIS